MGKSRESAGVRGQAAAKLHPVPRVETIELVGSCVAFTQYIYYKLDEKSRNFWGGIGLVQVGPEYVALEIQYPPLVL